MKTEKNDEAADAAAAVVCYCILLLITSLPATFVSDIAIFVLKRDVKLQLTSHFSGPHRAIALLCVCVCVCVRVCLYVWTITFEVNDL